MRIVRFLTLLLLAVTLASCVTTDGWRQPSGKRFLLVVLDTCCHRHPGRPLGHHEF